MLIKFEKRKKIRKKNEILKSYTLKLKIEVDFKLTLYWFDYLLMSVVLMLILHS